VIEVLNLGALTPGMEPVESEAGGAPLPKAHA